MSHILQDVSSVLEAALLNFQTVKYLIEDNGLVRWPCCTLDCGMGLNEEVPVASLCHTAVDHSPCCGLKDRSDSSTLGRVESGVVTLADNDHRELWQALFRRVGRV